jgi:outer membrane protein OmpA-like peptidoglycan-associated protein
MTTPLISRLVPSLVLLLAAGAATAADTADKQLNFVSCPIVRDTKEVPCWITRYKGETYYLGIQQDIGAAFYPPQLKHKVLVEGVVSNEPRICGGVVLKPVVVSSLLEVDKSCNTILPAGKYRIDFARRGAGPGRGGTPATEPSKPQPPRTPPAQEASSSPKHFLVRFDFDNTFMTIRQSGQVSAAAQYAASSHAKMVEVRGYRSATLLSSGKPLTERADIGELRATKVGQALREIGVPASAVHTAWNTQAEPATGTSDFESRKVEIVVTPGA